MDELPDFDDSSRAIETIRLACSFLKSHLSIAEQGRRLNRHSANTSVQIGKIPLKSGVPSRDQMTRFVNGSTTGYIPRTPDFALFAWDWLRTEHRGVLVKASETIANRFDEALPPLVKAFHTFLEPEQAFPDHTLFDLQGKFTGYRVSFIAPDTHIMEMALECGRSGDETAFVLSMSYPYLYQNKREHVEGYIIPYYDGGFVMFVGRLVEKVAPFMFILSEFSRERGRIVEAKGAALVGASGGEASAWPLLFVRTDTLPEPRSLSISELEAENGDSVRHIMEVMRRGQITRR